MQLRVIYINLYLKTIFSSSHVKTLRKRIHRFSFALPCILIIKLRNFFLSYAEVSIEREMYFSPLEISVQS